MIEEINSSQVTSTSYPASAQSYPPQLSGISFFSKPIDSLLPAIIKRDEEHSIKEHHDVVPNIDPCGHCDLEAEPLPFTIPDHVLDYVPAGLAYSAPFLIQDAPDISYIQEGPYNNGQYLGYVSISEPMPREVNACCSPRSASIQLPQSNSAAEPSTPIYRGENRFQPSSSKRVLFSPLYCLIMKLKP